MLFLRKEGEKEGGSPGWRVMLSVAGSLSPGTILLDVALNTNLEVEQGKIYLLFQSMKSIKEDITSMFSVGP